VADTQFRLSGSDPLSAWVHGVTERGHFAGRRVPTRQGIYVCTAGGELLASTPPADADTVLALLQRGLTAFEALPAAARRGPAPPARVPLDEDRYPADGLVLDLAARDLSAPGEPDRDGAVAERDPHAPRSAGPAARANLDHVWFSPAEARQWLPDPAHAGASRSLPDRLVERLTCLHFVDGVAGELARRFRPEDLRPSWIRTEVESRQGSRVRLRITGATRAESRAHARDRRADRIETELLGHAWFDEATGSFDAFELLALARCGELGEPPPGARERTVGFVLRLADPAAPRVPPHFLHRYGPEWQR